MSLAGRGVVVTRPRELAEAFVQLLERRGEVDAVTVLSAQALDNFIDITGGALAAGTPHFVPHERVAGHAQSRGVREIVLAAPGDDAMLERLVAYFDGRD